MNSQRTTRRPLVIAIALMLIRCSDGGSVQGDAGAADLGLFADCGAGLKGYGPACIPLTAKCDAGLKAYGPACVPVLADCQKDEVPLPGGGCKQAGVEVCDGGIKVPPDNKCKHIGPPSACASGWSVTQDGWCEPILPQKKCTAAGTMAMIGKATCQPIGDCGTGTYGKIKTSAATIFVDRSYKGGGSDGSQAKPYTSIGMALMAASSKAQIAVAAGEYAEDLSIGKQVMLEGRCAQMVTIKGQAKNPTAAVEVQADDTVVRGLTITGPKSGLHLEKARATVERVAVQDCGGRGVSTRGGATLTLRDSLVSGAHGAGVHITDSQVTLDRIMVRSTLPLTSDKKWGAGVYAISDKVPSTLSMRDCVVTGNRKYGIIVYSVKGTIERTVVRDTQAQAADNTQGWGIYAAAVNKMPASLDLKDCVVANNRTIGLCLWGASATIQRTVIRDILPQLSDSRFGTGIEVSPTPQVTSSLVMQDSAVVRSRYVGVQLIGSEATLERTVVRDILPRASDKALGLGIASDSKITLRDCLLSKARGIGLALEGATATVERTVVQNTLPMASNSTCGAGVSALPKVKFLAPPIPTKLALDDCRVDGNCGAGVLITGSKATIRRTVVRDSKEQPSGKLGGVGIDVASSDLPASLTMSDCVVASNKAYGIGLTDATATLARTVVRDTQAQAADSLHGYGILATRKKMGSTVAMTDCVVDGNRAGGIEIWGSKATLLRTRVSNTQAQAVDNSLGAGITADYKGAPSTLTMTDCEVFRNRQEGIGVWGSEATLTRTVVRDTLSRAADKMGGIGIIARWDHVPPELTMRDSVIAKNRTVGMILLGAEATLERSEVRDTLPQEFDKQFGAGIYADKDRVPTNLTINDCLVSNSQGAGVAVFASLAAFHRTVVRDTLKNQGPASNESYGDGIQVGFKAGQLQLTDSVVEGSARAGALFSEGGGSVRRSVFRRGVFAIDLENGAAPIISDDNQMIDNQINQVTFGRGLGTSPVPSVPNLPGLDAGPDAGPDAGISP